MEVVLRVHDVLSVDGHHIQRQISMYVAVATKHMLTTVARDATIPCNPCSIDLSTRPQAYSL